MKNSEFFVKRNKKRYYEIGGVFVPFLKKKDRNRIIIELAFRKFEKYLDDNIYTLNK